MDKTVIIGIRGSIGEVREDGVNQVQYLVPSFRTDYLRALTRIYLSILNY